MCGLWRFDAYEHKRRFLSERYGVSAAQSERRPHSRPQTTTESDEGSRSWGRENALPSASRALAESQSLDLLSNLGWNGLPMGKRRGPCNIQSYASFAYLWVLATTTCRVLPRPPQVQRLRRVTKTAKPTPIGPPPFESLQSASPQESLPMDVAHLLSQRLENVLLERADLKQRLADAELELYVQ